MSDLFIDPSIFNRYSCSFKHCSYYNWYFKGILNVLVFFLSFLFFLNFEEMIMKRHFRFDLWKREPLP